MESDLSSTLHGLQRRHSWAPAPSQQSRPASEATWWFPLGAVWRGHSPWRASGSLQVLLSQPGLCCGLKALLTWGPGEVTAPAGGTWQGETETLSPSPIGLCSLRRLVPPNPSEYEAA